MSWGGPHSARKGSLLSEFHRSVEEPDVHRPSLLEVLCSSQNTFGISSAVLASVRRDILGHSYLPLLLSLARSQLEKWGLASGVIQHPESPWL